MDRRRILGLERGDPRAAIKEGIFSPEKPKQKDSTPRKPKKTLSQLEKMALMSQKYPTPGRQRVEAVPVPVNPEPTPVEPEPTPEPETSQALVLVPTSDSMDLFLHDLMGPSLRPTHVGIEQTIYDAGLSPLFGPPVVHSERGMVVRESSAQIESPAGDIDAALLLAEQEAERLLAEKAARQQAPVKEEQPAAPVEEPKGDYVCNEIIWHERFSQGTRDDLVGVTTEEWKWIPGKPTVLMPIEPGININVAVPFKALIVMDKVFPLMMTPPFRNPTAGTDMDLLHLLCYRTNEATVRSMFATPAEIIRHTVFVAMAKYGKGPIGSDSRFRGKGAKDGYIALARGLLDDLRRKLVLPPMYWFALPANGRTDVSRKQDHPIALFASLSIAIYAMYTNGLSREQIKGREQTVPYTKGMSRRLRALLPNALSPVHYHRALWMSGCASLRFCPTASFIDALFFPNELMTAKNLAYREEDSFLKQTLLPVSKNVLQTENGKFACNWVFNARAFVWFMCSCPRNLTLPHVNAPVDTGEIAESVAYLLVPFMRGHLDDGQFVSLPAARDPQAKGLANVMTVVQARLVPAPETLPAGQITEAQRASYDAQARKMLKDFDPTTFWPLRTIASNMERGNPQMRNIDAVAAALSKLHADWQTCTPFTPIHYGAVGLAAMLAATIGTFRELAFDGLTAGPNWRCRLPGFYRGLADTTQRMAHFYRTIGQLRVDILRCLASPDADTVHTIATNNPDIITGEQVHMSGKSYYACQNVEHLDFLWSALQLSVRELIRWNWQIDSDEAPISTNPRRTAVSAYVRPLDDEFPRDLTYRIGTASGKKMDPNAIEVWNGKLPRATVKASRRKKTDDVYIRELLGEYRCADDAANFTPPKPPTDTSQAKQTVPRPHTLVDLAVTLADIQAQLELDLLMNHCNTISQTPGIPYVNVEVAVWGDGAPLAFTLKQVVHAFFRNVKQIAIGLEGNAEDRAGPHQVRVIADAGALLVANSACAPDVSGALALVQERPDSPWLRDSNLTIPVTLMMMVVLREWGGVNGRDDSQLESDGWKASHGAWFMALLRLLYGQFAQMFTEGKHASAHVNVLQTFEEWAVGRNYFSICNRMYLAVWAYDRELFPSPEKVPSTEDEALELMHGPTRPRAAQPVKLELVVIAGQPQPQLPMVGLGTIHFGKAIKK